MPEQGAPVLPPHKQKLHGRAFYKHIGSPKMILAPMVDQSEFAWRLLTRSYMQPGGSRDLLAYTPMLHSRLFRETQKFRDQNFQPLRFGLASPPPSPDQHPSNPPDAYLDGHPAFDRPLIVQFCANSPEVLLEAAKYVQPFCDAVDLNLGCPQGIARKGHYGAFLQENWDLIYKMINTLHLNLNVPVTAKMRILDTNEKTLDYARMIISAGASILTVHGRQRDQKGHKTGLADWKVLRFLRDHLPSEVVLFANGNILRHEDISRCLEMTGADGVMSAEGNLCDPTIFTGKPTGDGELREYWQGRDGRGGYRMDAVFRRYMDIIYRHVLEIPTPQRPSLFVPADSAHSGDFESSQDVNDEQPPSKKQKREKHVKPTSPNLLSMQAHLFHLLRPLVSTHHNVRDALARSRAGDMLAFENVLSLVEEAVKEGLLDYETNPERYEEDYTALETRHEAENTSDESSLASVRACKRPWWVCQPYVRPLPKEALEKGSLTLSKKERRKIEQRVVKDRQEEQMAREMGLKSENYIEKEEIDKEEGTKRNPRIEVPRQGLVCG